MKIALDIGSAAFAFLAAAFWFWSVQGKLPPMVPYYDEVPETDPYRIAVVKASNLNKAAAIFAGLSACCSGASTLMSYE